jgi:hypothetical protein
MRKLIITILVSGLFPIFVMAQFTVNAELRPRAEVRKGYKALPDSLSVPSSIISQRTRIGFTYQSEWLKTSVTIQDARIWGDENTFNSTGVYGDTASIDLYEGWVELSFLKNSSVKIGRQVFDYDDTRLLSTRNWGQTGITYDAILYKYAKDNWNLDAAISLNNKVDNTFGNNYPSGKMKTLNFIRIAKKINPDLLVSVIGIGSGYTADSKSETIYMRGSYGLYANYKKSPINLWTSFYYQNGKNNKGFKVSAWNWNVFGDYSFGKLGLNAGLTILSGDKTNDSADKDQLFDLLYGNRHRYYGLMDYFNNLPKSTGNGGLMDAIAGVNYQITQKTKLSADYHYFALQQTTVNIANVNTKLDSQLASEIDLSFRTNFSKVVYLEGGYSMMLPTSGLEIIQGVGEGNSKFAYWGWLMLTVKPEIFSSK